MEEQLIKQDTGYHTDFNGIYNLYYQRLVFFIRGFIGDQLAAEDIATDIFIKYWHKKENFMSAYKIRAYLFISARNACSSYRDRQQVQSGIKKDLLNLTPDYADPVLETITGRELLADAYTVVESLPQECRKIIRLCLIQGQKIKQIAGLLALSEQTVRNQKCRGIQLMQQRFAKLQIS